MKSRLENCPNKTSHMIGPSGYVERTEWAEEMRKTFRQERCPGCGLWVIWRPKAAESGRLGPEVVGRDRARGREDGNGTLERTMRKNTRAYFGGGVYAECTGFDIVLTANGVGNAATDRIHLDPQMIRELLEWQEAGYPDHETGKKFGVEETVLRTPREQMNCGRCPLDARDPDHDCAAPDCLDDQPLLNAETMFSGRMNQAER